MKNYTKIICILDRSGSMSSIIDDAIGGFNSFLRSQKEVDGDATMTSHLFDTQYDTIYKDVDIQLVKDFNRNTYVPRGGTALYDSIGKTIDDEIEYLSAIPVEERPEKTLCIILTDGEENSSNKYGRELIKEMIDEMRSDFKWEFIFLAANQDASLKAEAMGISKGNSMTFAYSGAGVGSAYATLNNATTMYRSCTVTDTSNLIKDENSQEVSNITQDKPTQDNS